MSKELMKNLLIEFDEMGFEPTTLCDTEKEVDSFRNRLKQVLDYLKAIDNSNPSEALECLKQIEDVIETKIGLGVVNTYLINTIKQALINFDLTKDFLKDLSKLTNETNLNKIMKKLQEQEKVRKIIFEKGLSLTEREIIKQSENYEQYQIKISWWNYKPFAIPKTEEEFDLLKRYCDEIR